MEDNAMWRGGQRLERCTYKQRTTTDNHQSPEARKEAWNGFFCSASRRFQPCQHLDFRLLASSTGRKWISVILSCPVCDTLSQQLQGTNTRAQQELSRRLMTRPRHHSTPVLCDSSISCPRAPGQCSSTFWKLNHLDRQKTPSNRVASSPSTKKKKKTNCEAVLRRELS